MKKTGKRLQSVLVPALMVALAGCTSVGPDGASGTIGLSPSSAPIVGPGVQQYNDTKDAAAAVGADATVSALEAAVTIPLTLFTELLYDDGTTPVPVRQPTYDERLIARRTQMGLPAPANRRVVERQSQYRLALEGRRPPTAPPAQPGNSVEPVAPSPSPVVTPSASNAAVSFQP